jgi:hypothetical protein
VNDASAVIDRTATAGPGRRVSGAVLTVLLTLAVAAALLLAVAVTLLYVGLGWPRAGLLSVVTVIVAVAWAPIVGLVIAAGSHDQAWWTPRRLALGLASLLASMLVLLLWLDVL